MAKTKQTRNWSKIGAPTTKIPIMVDSVGNQSSLSKPTSLLKGSSMASSLENIDNLQNKRNDKNNISYKYMNKSNLSKLTKNQLIELLLNQQTPKSAPRSKWRKQETTTPTPLPRRNKYIPIPYPRPSVKQMVQNYENTIIAPPKLFMNTPIPLQD